MADKCARRKRVTLRSADYEVYACESGHVHVDVDTPELRGHLVFADTVEASDFSEAVMRCFDEIEGIAPRK